MSENWSEEEEELEASPEGSEEEDGGTPKKKRKGKLLSGIFAKASSTKIVRSVLHAHAMLDTDEVPSGDVSLAQLPFHLLVAGELEIILSNISADEKWSRLQMLKKLAYKLQILKVDMIIESYASFLRKVEKGTYKWGLEDNIRELENNLRFRVVTDMTVTGGGSREGKVVGRKKMGEEGKSTVNDGGEEHRLPYCADFNRGVNLQNRMKDGITDRTYGKYICVGFVGKRRNDRMFTEKVVCTARSRQNSSQ